MGRNQYNCPVTEQEADEIVQRYVSGVNLRKVAREMQRSPTAIRGVLRRRQIPMHVGSDGKSKYTPTPQQIAEAAKEVRAEWSPEERERRRQHKPQQWEVPVCHVMHHNRLRGSI
jgi:hypothetical protein